MGSLVFLWRAGASKILLTIKSIQFDLLNGRLGGNNIKIKEVPEKTV